MRVTIKYAYSENGTRNGRIYSQEVLEKAFNELTSQSYNQKIK